MTLFRRFGPAVLLCAPLFVLFAGAPTAQRSAPRLIPAPEPGAAAVAQSQGQALERFRARLAARGELRLIVEVRTPSRVAAIEAIDPQQDLPDGPMMAAARRRVMNRLPPRAYPVHEFETIPFITMAADLATFEVLRGDPDVVSIQEDYAVPPTLVQSVPLVQANLAWAQGYTGAGRTVAILDSGVQKGHAAFEGRVVSEACYSGGGSSAQSLCPGGVTSSVANNSAAPCSSSLDGGSCFHGTHVAGIAAGSNGVAKDASIIAIQVFSNISGDMLAYWTDIIKALERVYALRKKYDIAAVNMSLGSSGYNVQCDAALPSVAAAITNLFNYRIATVVSSGNGSSGTHISFPACIAKAISVGSTTKSDVVSSFSNASTFLSLLAPGSSITAPYPFPGGTATASGTSMAAPHVAGAWAILEHKTPGLKVATGLSVLRSGGLNVVDSRNGLTFKRIRIANALNRLTALPAAVTIAPSGPSSATPTFSWNIAATATQYRLLVRPAAGGTAVVDTVYSATSVCGASTCSVTPSVVFANGVTYNWWVQSIDFGKGPLSTVKSFTPSSGLPPATTLIAPSGSSSTMPMYQWTNIAAATGYRLFVQVVGGATVIDSSYPSGAVCASSPCGVGPATTLAAGVQHRWRVRTSNLSGVGPWSEYTYFTPVALPPATTLVSPSGAVNTLTPTFTWQKVGTATSYILFIQPTAGGDAVTSSWQASAACGSTTCTATPSGALVAGTQYRWKVRTRNAAGSGAWSTYLTFTPSSGLPGAATLISPNTALANQFPTYRWNKVAAATRYYLTVRNSAGVVFSQNYLSTDVCGSTTCQITPTTPLGGGSFSWRIQTRNTAGYGPLSAAMSFSTVSTTMSMVLTWGANPADLDSHLRTPSGHHVYWANKGSATSTPFATLDVDDRSGYGPETVFIHQVQGGSYRYYVHRYSGSGTLAGSGAQVKLYRGSTLLATYTAPATGSGDYWHVCTITNASTGARTCPNTISTVAPSVEGFAPAEMPEKKGDAGVAGDGGEDDASKRRQPALPSRPRQGGPPRR